MDDKYFTEVSPNTYRCINADGSGHLVFCKPGQDPADVLADLADELAVDAEMMKIKPQTGESEQQHRQRLDRERVKIKALRRPRADFREMLAPLPQTVVSAEKRIAPESEGKSDIFDNILRNRRSPFGISASAVIKKRGPKGSGDQL